MTFPKDSPPSSPRPRIGRMGPAVAVFVLTVLLGWSVGSAVMEARDRARDHDLARFVADATALSQPRQFPPTPPAEETVLPTCLLPPPSDAAKIALVTLYDSRSLADVSVGGQEIATHTARVVIEPGADKLYLVLSSHAAMLWRVEGATERVENAVLFTMHGPPTAPAAGATGLPAAAVTALHMRTCLASGALKYDSLVPPAFTVALGRPVDFRMSSYSVAAGLALPSGTETIAPPTAVPAGFDPASWQKAQRFYSAGLVRVDPADVVGSNPAERYTVLPNQMGLSQLVGAGALEVEGQDRFRVVRPIDHYPAGMHGAHSVTLILEEGIPIPAGDPGHSCVLTEPTLKPVRPSLICR